MNLDFRDLFAEFNTHGVEYLVVGAHHLTSLTDQSDDKACWHAKSPYKRLQAVEALRQLNYGRHQSTARLQRVLEVAQRTSG